MAAALLAALAFILLRLVTLWVRLTVPKDTEWEWCLDVELRVGMFEGGVEVMESLWEL